MTRLALGLVVMVAAGSCAHDIALAKANRPPSMVDALPSECGPKATIARPELVLTHDERDTLAPLDGSCRTAVRERDDAGQGACASLVEDFAGWRRQVLAKLAGAARARRG